MTEAPDWVKNSQVGDKIVCVHGGDWRNGLGQLISVCPRAGEIYTISQIEMNTIYNQVMFSLKEISPSKTWQWKGFKPLTRKPTDITIFEKMLKEKQNEIFVN